jgi:D-3-phosphoglycerate dehydrogenase / 2-oxoglutarate reductase
MVAEAVRLALRGEFVPSAVNVQVRAGIPEAVKPFMPLAETLGRSAHRLHSRPGGELTVEYVGKLAEEDTQALTLSALKGMLSASSSEPVTFVNAPLLAEERGLKVSTVTSSSSRTTSRWCGCARATSRRRHARRPEATSERLVEVWGFDVDMEPTDHMVFFRYADRPGIVGLIGGKLGEAGVNIATMQVGRQRGRGRGR